MIYHLMFKVIAHALDLQHYNHLAHTKKEAQEAAYKRWVESHTVDEIDVANAARASLRRKDTVKRPVQKWPFIKDERAVKQPMTAFIYFFMSRQASGDFKNVAVTDRTRLAGQEYKALSEDEKEVRDIPRPKPMSPSHSSR